MNAVYNIDAKKKATNLSVNSDLLKLAKMLKINLSKNFEAYLAEVVTQKLEEQWHRENREAIEAYNDEIAKRGTFAKSLRRF
jgi:antitoxin CcdA